LKTSHVETKNPFKESIRRGGGGGGFFPTTYWDRAKGGKEGFFIHSIKVLIMAQIVKKCKDNCWKKIYLNWCAQVLFIYKRIRLVLKGVQEQFGIRFL
jgi:hypothetical protein